MSIQKYCIKEGTKEEKSSFGTLKSRYWSGREDYILQIKRKNCGKIFTLTSENNSVNPKMIFTGKRHPLIFDSID